KITRDEWLRGKLQNSPQHFAIVLDGEIRSFPQIDYTDSSLSDGIDPINGAQITGIGSLREAKDLAKAADPRDLRAVDRVDSVGQARVRVIDLRERPNLAVEDDREVLRRVLELAAQPLVAGDL